MKKLTTLLIITAIGLSSFAQNRISDKDETTNPSDADLMLLQQQATNFDKSVRLDTLRSYFSSQIVQNTPTVDSVAGTSGQFIISDGVGWLSAANATYEGSSAFTFGSRIPATSIGNSSFVFGYGSATAPFSLAAATGRATGTDAIALGSNTASGYYSVAIGGLASIASGTRSAVYNGLQDTASGISSTNIGSYQGKNTGDYSILSGYQCEVSGDYAVNGGGFANEAIENYAFNGGGTGNTVSGNKASNGSGDSNTVSGTSASNGGGNNNTISGTFASNLAGKRNFSQSYAETTLGLFNDTAASTTATSYVATDRLLTIGNGTDIGSRSNALVMLKNGNTTASGNWDFEGGITSTYTSHLTKSVAKFHRIDKINTQAPDEWTDFEWDTAIMNETTVGFNFNSDSTGFVYEGSAGIIRVQGCGHTKFNGSATATAAVYIRVLIDGVEARCLQANDAKERQENDENTILYTGTAYIEGGSTIDVQYRVTDDDMDFEGSPIFDNPVAASVNFEFMSKDK